LERADTFYEQTGGVTDDGAGQRKIFGVKDPCYDSVFDPECTTPVGTPLLDVTNIANVVPNPDNGWVIALDADAVPDATFRAERVITDPLAATTGVVFFTTYKPYRDQCALGGKSYIWAVKYDSGGSAGTLLQGKALIQVFHRQHRTVGPCDCIFGSGRYGRWWWRWGRRWGRDRKKIRGHGRRAADCPGLVDHFAAAAGEKGPP